MLSVKEWHSFLHIIFVEIQRIIFDERINVHWQSLMSNDSNTPQAKLLNEVMQQIVKIVERNKTVKNSQKMK